MKIKLPFMAISFFPIFQSGQWEVLTESDYFVWRTKVENDE